MSSRRERAKNTRVDPGEKVKKTGEWLLNPIVIYANGTEEGFKI